MGSDPRHESQGLGETGLEACRKLRGPTHRRRQSAMRLASPAVPATAQWRSVLKPRRRRPWPKRRRPWPRPMRAARRQDLHDTQEPCRRGDCKLAICATAHRAAKKNDSKPSSESRRGAAPTGEEQWRGEARAEWRRAELHAKLLPCGLRDCDHAVCRKARQPTIARSSAKTAAPGRQGRQRPQTTSGKPVGSRVTPNKSGEQLALERAQAKHRSVAGTAGAPGWKDGKIPKAAKQMKPKPATRAAPRPLPTLTCRECLKTKPISKFPDPARKRCEACGGQPRSRSIQTLSGGLPGLGRRR